MRYDLIGFDGFQDENFSLKRTSSVDILKLNITKALQLITRFPVLNGFVHRDSWRFYNLIASICSNKDKRNRKADAIRQLNRNTFIHIHSN